MGSAAPATFNAKRDAIATFTAFCRDRGRITGDPFAGLARTRSPNRSRAPGRAQRSTGSVEPLLVSTAEPRTGLGVVGEGGVADGQRHLDEFVSW
ncbi:hypothetical protein [Amycolatopsis sp. NPDC051071]|uniref:hypothetical protein n=1 Tax=Amycolatopsis sp. NPDC051071 TaxID=3154637 RepID=UPI00342EF8F6